MASVRVDWTGLCPFAAMAFIVVSFHCTTSLAAGWAKARLNRQAITPADARARPKIRTPRFMSVPPFSAGCAQQSRILGLPVTRGVDCRLERRPVLEQGRLDDGIHLLVDPRLV